LNKILNSIKYLKFGEHASLRDENNIIIINPNKEPKDLPVRLDEMKLNNTKLER
jgi:hypothetical protein